MSAPTPDRAHVKQYDGPGISVSYDSARCIHAAECVRGLPTVFDTKRRPWIEPAAASAAEVVSVIRRCPSGALQFSLADGPAEEPVRPTRISFQDGGPMVLAGDLRLELGDGEQVETRATICVCGRSGNGPFCDLACRES
jgi:uncharacterized Fe-S cluster protein YjdI/CDGSH-type Zn-finger protein